MKLPFEKDPQLIEHGVELGPIEACSLGRAFAENHEKLEELLRKVAPQTLASLMKLLTKIENIHFIPSEEERIVLAQLAKLEKKRLQIQPPYFSCEHSINEHEIALDSIINKVARKTN